MSNSLHIDNTLGYMGHELKGILNSENHPFLRCIIPYPDIRLPPLPIHIQLIPLE